MIFLNDQSKNNIVTEGVSVQSKEDLLNAAELIQNYIINGECCAIKKVKINVDTNNECVIAEIIDKDQVDEDIYNLNKIITKSIMHDYAVRCKGDKLYVVKIKDTNPSIVELLDNTDLKHIYLTSDWHLFCKKYKKIDNPVKTREIIKWCKDNIKDKDVFIYLGDMCFRFASDEDNKKTQEIFKSIPGIKILVIGNHDEVAGEDFYLNCGFDYVVSNFTWHEYLFTHRPENIDMYAGIKRNIHGHQHDYPEYNTTDGSNHVNVYPFYFDNKPVSLNFVINNFDRLVKRIGNKRSNWLGMGESTYLQNIKFN